MGAPSDGPGPSDLFDEPDLLLVERVRVFAVDAAYDVHAPDGRLLATVQERSGPPRWLLGQWAASSYEVTVEGAPDRGPLLLVDRPGAVGPGAFAVRSGDGTPLGRVVQESAWTASRFRLDLADGRSAALVGGGPGSRDWTVLAGGPGGAPVAGVHREVRDLAQVVGGADTYRVGTAPGADRVLRALVLVGAVAVDAVRDAHRRRRRPGSSVL